MKIIKPVCVNYKGEPIFSIHIHPDGTRFATGGILNDSGQVSVWSFDLFEDSTNGKHRLLCQMSNHLGCVNCVRWNHTGNWLASAGVDKGVIIWQLRGRSTQNEQFNLTAGDSWEEPWSCYCILRGHLGEVLDLEWSLSDSYLASCSVDNTIIVWNGAHFPDKIHVITQHSGMVKGVCWDPIGKYLASQSDDRSLRVWRTEDWLMETQLREPFQQCSGTTHLLRLSWSPDGRNIATAHALNNTFPVAYIVDRNNWETDHSLVGHQKAIEVAAFNPNLFSYDQKATRGHTVVALGSKDSSISIWSTAKTKPILVIDNIFTSSILDLSWSPDGYRLLACSWDSTVVYLSFSQSELGYVLDLSHLLKLHMDIYGCTSLPSSGGLLNSSLIETPMMLSLHQTNPPHPPPDKIERTNVNSEHLHQPIQPTSVSMQVENRTKEGKRRITPKFISPPSHLALVSIPIRVPENNKLTTSLANSTASLDIPSQHTLSTNTNAAHPLTSASAEDPSISTTNSVTSTVPNLSSANMNHSAFPTTATNSVISTVTASTSSKREQLHELNSTNRMSSIAFETPNYSMHIDNSRSFGALLRVFTEPSKHWDVILFSQVVCYACSEHYLIMACSDSSMHVFSVSGRRLLAPLQLSSAVFKISVSDNFLIAITSELELHMWDIAAMRSVITSQPVSPLLANTKLKIISLSVLDRGPMLTLSNDTSYLFNISLCTWQCISLNYSQHSQSDFNSHPYSSLSTIGTSSIARSQSFIEAQLNSALAVNSKQDYLKWLRHYVEFLTDHELSLQLKELLKELIKPILDETDFSDLTPSQKMTSEYPTFIKTLIAIVAKNVNLQRVYAEFSELLQLSSDD